MSDCALHQVKQESASVLLLDKEKAQKDAVNRTGGPVHLIQPPLLAQLQLGTKPSCHSLPTLVQQDYSRLIS